MKRSRKDEKERILSFFYCWWQSFLLNCTKEEIRIKIQRREIESFRMKFCTVRIVDENDPQSEIAIEVQKNRFTVTNCGDQDVWILKPDFILQSYSGVYTIQLTERTWKAEKILSTTKNARRQNLCQLKSFSFHEFVFIWITADYRTDG